MEVSHFFTVPTRRLFLFFYWYQIGTVFLFLLFLHLIYYSRLLVFFIHFVHFCSGFWQFFFQEFWANYPIFRHLLHLHTFAFHSFKSSTVTMIALNLGNTSFVSIAISAWPSNLTTNWKATADLALLVGSLLGRNKILVVLSGGLMFKMKTV